MPLKFFLITRFSINHVINHCDSHAYVTVVREQWAMSVSSMVVTADLLDDLCL